MIKYICDCCKKEITSPEMGGFQIKEKQPFWDKHQKGEQLRVREYMFCIECARKVWEHFQDLAKMSDKNGHKNNKTL